MVNQFTGSADGPAAIHARLWTGLRRQPSARPWRWRWSTARCAHDELGEDVVAPAQDEEFVLYHSDNVQATGFVEHLKLPHYVDFQAELGLIRQLRASSGRMPHDGEPQEAAE